VGTGIAYCFTRSPLAMAAEAADIQALAGGRCYDAEVPGSGRTSRPTCWRT
jgi:hypothetical protein